MIDLSLQTDLSLPLTQLSDVNNSIYHQIKFKFYICCSSVGSHCVMGAVILTEKGRIFSLDSHPRNVAGHTLIFIIILSNLFVNTCNKDFKKLCISLSHLWFVPCFLIGPFHRPFQSYRSYVWAKVQNVQNIQKRTETYRKYS